MVESLLRLASCARCGIAVSVGILARSAIYLGHGHMRACKRVVQYLYNTRAMGIGYRRPDANKDANGHIIYEGASACSL